MRACLLAVLATLALGVAAPARAHVNGGLGFEGADELAISLEDGVASADVRVRNTATDAILPTFTAFVRNPDGEFVQLRGTAAGGAPVEADGARAYHLTFSGPATDGAKGQLVAIGAGSPATVDVAIARHPAAGLAVPGAIVLALLAAGALALVARRPARAV